MPERIQKRKQSTKQEVSEEQDMKAAPAKADTEATDKLLEDIDALLDEMLTDQTAQEFVDSFQQKGGE